MTPAEKVVADVVAGALPAMRLFFYVNDCRLAAHPAAECYQMPYVWLDEHNELREYVHMTTRLCVYHGFTSVWLNTDMLKTGVQIVVDFFRLRGRLLNGDLILGALSAVVVDLLIRRHPGDRWVPSVQRPPSVCAP